jgi:hypothetical protein
VDSSLATTAYNQDISLESAAMTVSMTLLAITALLSAVFTAALFWGLYQWRLRPQLEDQLTRMQVEFEQRVKSGALAAGEELLPKFREQVSLGFQDALARSRAAGLVEGAAGAVNLGADFLGSSLSAVLGIKPRK